MSGVATTFLWQDGVLAVRDDCDILPASIEVADSWYVTEGTALALDLHRSRFMTGVPRGRYLQFQPGEFWDAAIAAIPREGDWFPRVELRTQLLRPGALPPLRPTDGPEAAP